MATQDPSQRICPWCGKVSHATRAAASWWAWRESRGAGIRLRVYCCPVTRRWHLTSRRPGGADLLPAARAGGPGSRRGGAAGGKRELSVLSETVANVDFVAFYRCRAQIRWCGS